MADKTRIKARRARRTEAQVYGMAQGTVLLDYPEAAKRLGVAVNTLKTYIATGKLANVVLGRKTKRIREADLEAFIQMRVRLAQSA